MTAPRSRGVIALLEPNCTACMICARECPDWCIHIESHSVVTPAPGGRGRPITETVLDRFAIDFGRCLYCGICVDVCPFDALHWAPDPLRPGVGDGAVDALVHERDLLGEWSATVPAPPPLDPAAAAAPEAGPGASRATPRRPGGTPRSG